MSVGDSAARRARCTQGTLLPPPLSVLPGPALRYLTTRGSLSPSRTASSRTAPRSIRLTLDSRLLCLRRAAPDPTLGSPADRSVQPSIISAVPVSPQRSTSSAPANGKAVARRRGGAARAAQSHDGARHCGVLLLGAARGSGATMVRGGGVGAWRLWAGAWGQGRAGSATGPAAAMRAGVGR